MKKSWNLIIALILTTVLLISCGEKSTKEIPSQKSETNNTSINKETNSMKEDENKEEIKDNNEISLEKGYYGSFKITKYIPTKAVEGFGRKSVNDYIGEEISIAKEQITIPEGKIKNPNYKETVMNEDEFYTNYRVDFKNIEVSDKTIIIVEVVNYDITDKYGDKVGKNIILAGNDRYYTLISGALFQLTKVS